MWLPFFDVMMAEERMMGGFMLVPYRKDTQRLIDAGHSIVLKKHMCIILLLVSPIEKDLQKTHTWMRRMRKRSIPYY